MDSIQVLQNRAAKMVLDRAPHSSSTEALVDLNWVNLTTELQVLQCKWYWETKRKTKIKCQNPVGNK